MLEKHGFAIVHTMRLIQIAESKAVNDSNPIAPPYGQGNLATIAVDNAWALVEKLALSSSKRGVARIKTAMGLKAPTQDFLDACAELRRRIEEELSEKYFLFVPNEFAPFWETKDAFGLGKKFIEAHDDIMQAGNCLALGQGTACVMHLARAMEPAIHRLARRTGISIGPRDSWGKILNAMDGKIRKMPDSTTAQQRKKDKWSEAFVLLTHVKNAWRDRPMHAKQNFTQSQAKDVISAVRTFMTHFATL